MDYFSHYSKLIEKRRSEHPNTYSEDHHIIPSSTGGPDIPENRLRLTAKEHLIAHLLLVKMYPGNDKLIWAASMMSNFKRCGSRKYAWLREKHSGMMREKMTGHVFSEETRNKISASHLGKKKTPEHTKKISDSRRKNPEYLRSCVEIMQEFNLGKSHSEEWCQKISDAHKGKVLGIDHRQKIREYFLGKTRPQNEVECPHCGKKGSTMPMHRWHFSNCKEAKNGQS